MFGFYASKETISRLLEPSKTKTLLIGGFNGYWNFGDLIQLLGAVRWHNAHQPGSVVCPLLDQRAFSNSEELALLSGLFGTGDWLLYTYDEEERQGATALGLHQIELADTKGATTLHIYGGGFLNHFYGDYLLAIMEQVLESLSTTHYVMSGQQVGPEYASRLADHCRKFKPELIGCRDAMSMDALAEHGLNTVFSGDDALDELLRYGAQAKPPGKSGSAPLTFGLNIRLTQDIYRAPTEDADPNQKVSLVRDIDAIFRLLHDRFGSVCCPVVATSVLDARHISHDGWAAIRGSLLGQYFPHFTGLDLSGAFLNGRLAEAAGTLRGLRLFVSMSYHAALLSQILRVPTYLLAFNRYYAQKQRGLGLNYADLDDFLKSDPQEILARQDLALSQHRQRREDWLRLMGSRMGVTGGPAAPSMSPDADDRANKGHPWLHLAEQQSQADARGALQVQGRVAEMERAAEAMKQQNEALTLQNEALNQQNEVLERQNGTLLNANADLTGRTSELAETVESLKQQGQALAAERVRLQKGKSDLEGKVESLTLQTSQLQERLDSIVRSRAWRVIQRYRRALDGPVGGRILRPIRRGLMSIFWRGDK